MIYAMILFAVTYILMLTFSQYRPYIALASGATLGGCAFGTTVI